MTGPERSAVKRVDTQDLPQTSWACFRLGHAWAAPVGRFATGRGVDAEEEMSECLRGCGRWRREVIDARNGELLHREYGGGTYAWAGFQPTRQEARLHELQRRRQEKAMQDKLSSKAAKR